MASGDVVNTAARLQSAAPVNGILVDETTYRATDQKIDYAESEPVTAKGKPEPVPAWEVIDARSSYGVDVGQARRAPLIGRERELDVLVSALERVRAERSPQLVTLVGVPGIGKSRLVYELSQVIEGEAELTSWRQGRSLPYGEGVSFWALSEMVKAQAGILETDSSEEAAEKLTRSVRALVDDSEAEWVERHLGTLIGLEKSEQDLPGDHRAEAFAAWRRFFEGIADQRPARPRLRGSALGRRGAPRLRRPSRRLGGRGADPRGLHGSPRALVQAGRVGRRKAERPYPLPVAARRRPDCAPPGSPARALGAPGRHPDGAAPESRWQPAVRGGVRADGDRPRARRRRARAPHARVGAGNRCRTPRRAARRREDASPGRLGPRKGVLAGRRGGDRGCRPDGGRGCVAQARTEGVRASRASRLGRGRERIRIRAPAGARRGVRADSARSTCRETSPRRRMDREARAARRSRRDARAPLLERAGAGPRRRRGHGLAARGLPGLRWPKPGTAHMRSALSRRRGGSMPQRWRSGRRTSRRARAC